MKVRKKGLQHFAFLMILQRQHSCHNTGSGNFVSEHIHCCPMCRRVHSTLNTEWGRTASRENQTPELSATSEQETAPDSEEAPSQMKSRCLKRRNLVVSSCHCLVPPGLHLWKPRRKIRSHKGFGNCSPFLGTNHVMGTSHNNPRLHVDGRGLPKQPQLQVCHCR